MCLVQWFGAPMVGCTVRKSYFGLANISLSGRAMSVSSSCLGKADFVLGVEEPPEAPGEVAT
jgi:hypothetical protein